MNKGHKSPPTTSHPSKGTSSPPKDDPSGRPLSDDEKIDEAIRESFGTSDAPSYSGTTGVGAPAGKKINEKKEGRSQHHN